MVQNFSLNSAVNAKQPKTTTLATQAVEMNKNLAAIVEKLDDIAEKVATPQPIEINFNITILLIIFNLFIPWWLYRDRSDPLLYLLNSIQKSPLYTEAIKELENNPQLLAQVKAICEDIDLESLESEEFLERSAEERQWEERAAKIQDLCLELLKSSPATSSKYQEQDTGETGENSTQDS